MEIAWLIENNGLTLELEINSKSMNIDTVDFITYCIGNLSRKLNLCPKEVYHRLKSSGILSGTSSQVTTSSIPSAKITLSKT